jgi:hypothetical protein
MAALADDDLVSMYETAWNVESAGASGWT